MKTHRQIRRRRQKAERQRLQAIPKTWCPACHNKHGTWVHDEMRLCRLCMASKPLRGPVWLRDYDDGPERTAAEAEEREWRKRYALGTMFARPKHPTFAGMIVKDWRANNADLLAIIDKIEKPHT